jgi:diphthamide synthase (EF-2-diphthine--ammonia ligase)
VFLDRSYLDKIAHKYNAFLYEPRWMMNSEALLREEIKNLLGLVIQK